MQVLIIAATGDPATDLRLLVARKAMEGWGIPYSEYIIQPASAAIATAPHTVGGASFCLYVRPLLILLYVCMCLRVCLSVCVTGSLSDVLWVSPLEGRYFAVVVTTELLLSGTAAPTWGPHRYGGEGLYD